MGRLKDKYFVMICWFAFFCIIIYSIFNVIKLQDEVGNNNEKEVIETYSKSNNIFKKDEIEIKKE